MGGLSISTTTMLKDHLPAGTFQCPESHNITLPKTRSSTFGMFRGMRGRFKLGKRRRYSFHALPIFNFNGTAAAAETMWQPPQRDHFMTYCRSCSQPCCTISLNQLKLSRSSLFSSSWQDHSGKASCGVKGSAERAGYVALRWQQANWLASLPSSSSAVA